MRDATDCENVDDLGCRKGMCANSFRRKDLFNELLRAPLVQAGLSPRRGVPASLLQGGVS